MGSIAYTSKDNGALFIQPSGVNTRPQYLGCYDVDDLTESRGSLNPLYCIDENGDYVIAGTTQDAPEIITFNVSTYTGLLKEFFESVACPMTLFMNIVDCGKKNVFENWGRSAIIDLRAVTSRTLVGWIKRAEDTEMMTTFELSAAPPIIDAIQLIGNQQTIAETENINNVVFYNDAQCAGRCGSRLDVCQHGILTTDSDGIAAANVWYTTDGGSTWTATATQPFAVSEDILGAAVVQIGKDSYRWIVGRGTTDALNPAEIAYSDDDGATWTAVNVGAVNGEFFQDANAIFAYNRWNIWAVTDGGYVYQSADAGETWTAQESGTLTAGAALNAVYFRTESIGMAVSSADDVIITTDGGDTWSAATATGGAAVLSSLTYSDAFWWTGDDAGGYYYSDDQGTTWSQRTGFTGSGVATTTIHDIGFANKYIGFMLLDLNGTGGLAFTIDGGYTWSDIQIISAGVPSSLYVCGTDKVYMTAASGYVGLILPDPSKGS